MRGKQILRVFKYSLIILISASVPGCGNIDFSTCDHTTAPANVVTTPGDSRVTLAWDSTPDVSYYIVFMREQSGVSPSSYDVLTSTLTDTSFTFWNLTNGKTYYFMVVAYDCNEYKTTLYGHQSTEVSATPST